MYLMLRASMKKVSIDYHLVINTFQGIVASKRDIHIHGLSIDDLQFNGAMRELRAPHRKGHHLTFFSSDPAFCKPDICAVFDKTSGPAEMVLSRSEDNVPLGTKFLGSLIREELQQQKSYCTAMIKVTGVVGFEEKALVVKA
uniref:PPC domain-containing protein n=1 Tax=Steinernema glaseri TaxID=37863 RepID=A0A1I7Y017_9BILA